MQIENRLLDLIYEKYLGSVLTEEEAALVKTIDDDLLYYDLRVLLNELSDKPAPKLHIQLDYDFVPFVEVAQTYLEIFRKGK